MEEHEHDRRKDDERFAEFMGEFRQWKIESSAWRDSTDKKIKEVAEFMDEMRAPRKLIVYTIRAIGITAVGAVATAFVGFVKNHVR